jgi:hypothetical protein
LCQQAYFYADNLFVRALRGEAELGAYNVGVRILSVLIMVALYASQASLPVARAASTPRDAWAKPSRGWRSRCSWARASRPGSRRRGRTSSWGVSART